MLVQSNYGIFLDQFEELVLLFLVQRNQEGFNAIDLFGKNEIRVIDPPSKIMKRLLSHIPPFYWEHDLPPPNGAALGCRFGQAHF
jgi:hypothetical protein